ncbi:YidB family protein [Limnohabitans sp. Rim8]|uniref:YidB family protein n=1 Tax=Limnohabitans sp. Rim8 TaxID=1100718 RepID=UPI00330570ED
MLAHEFQDKGLDGVVSSWIGTGENLPISAEQLTSVLGSSHLQEMAQKVGLPVDGLTEKLSVLPPQVVDQLTPTGSVPEEGGLLAQGMGMLGGLLK